MKSIKTLTKSDNEKIGFPQFLYLVASFDYRVFSASKLCLIIIICFLFNTNIVNAQLAGTFDREHLIENFEVYPGDSTIKHGNYQLFYKSHLIESGFFNKGVKSGIWTFFSLGNVFEFQYDFDNDSIVRISNPEQQLLLGLESPCLFLGSPIVPYLFLLSEVGYPLKAYQEGIHGKVDLYLIISENGEIIHRYTGKIQHSILSAAVLKASYNFLPEWRFIPERRNNKRIKSLYKITIFFELD